MEIALLQNQLAIMLVLKSLLKKGDPINDILKEQIEFTKARIKALSY